MKFLVVILASVAAVCAQGNSGQYNPYERYAQSTPAPVRYRPVTGPPTVTIAPRPAVTIAPRPFVAPSPTRVPLPIPSAGNDFNAQILKYVNDIGPDGSYSWAYETSNGIAAQEQGTPRVFNGNPPQIPVVAQGSFSFTSPEGVPVAITYIADENGFQPSGNVLPTPPPIPPQIARALEYIAKNAPRQ